MRDAEENAPATIWATPWGGTTSTDDGQPGRGMIAVENRDYWSALGRPTAEPVEYIRADLARAEADDLKTALRRVLGCGDRWPLMKDIARRALTAARGGLLG